MNQKHRIALATEEHSLIELHEKILKLLEKQPVDSRKLIEQLIDYYNKLILCMPGNVYWIDKDCKSVGCNQNVLDMFGLSEQQQFYNLTFAEMASIGNWSKDQGISFEHDTLEVIHSGKPKANVEEPPIPDTQGNLLYFLSTRVPLYNAKSEVIGIVGISTDISKQKRTEIALEHANKVKSEFLANLSHDLRTPLASLAVLTEHLSNQIEDRELNQIAYDAQSCAEQVMLLIDEILEITEIDLGLVPKQDQVFNLEHLIFAVYNLMKSSATQKFLEINYSFDKNIPEILVGKRQLLHRILMNLLSNAIKFTRKGYINIDVTLVENYISSVLVKIDVIDTGIGIPKDKYEQIFQQFERLTSAYEGEYFGRGLGLYIVKQFVELMDGKILIESLENAGSKFSILLTLKIASTTEKKYLVQEYMPRKRRTNMKQKSEKVSSVFEKTTSVQTSNINKANVLLIEDTEIARKVALLVFAPLNCEIDIAINGREAINKIKNKKYDLVLLDIGLPDISGLEVAKQVRLFEADHSRLPVPIIALTAHIPQSSIQQCLNAGIQQVIKKPLSMNRAKALFENWISEKSDFLPTFPDLSKKSSIMNEILIKFLQELPAKAVELEKTFKHEDLNDFRSVVHYVHGAASYLHLIDLEKSCNSMESAIIDEFSQVAIDHLYDDLMNEIRLLLKNTSA